MATVIAIKPGFKPMNQKFEATCASCNLRELCLPGALCAEELARVENVVYARRRLKRALRSFDAELLRVLEPEAWREQVLGQAAAKLATSGAIELRELLLELLECWPATAELQLRNNGDLAAGIQLCPPARTLLLRISHAAIGALGL